MQKYIVPKQGLIVRDPKSFTPLPATGMLVDWKGNAGRFWRRRVTQGDAYIVQGEKLEKLLKELADKKAEQAEKVLEEQESAEPKTTSKRRSK